MWHLAGLTVVYGVEYRAVTGSMRRRASGSRRLLTRCTYVRNMGVPRRESFRTVLAASLGAHRKAQHARVCFWPAAATYGAR